MIERICYNCNNFFPETFDEYTEYGICLGDDAFEPYIDEVLKGNHDICRGLIEEKKILGDKKCCDLYSEIENVDDPEIDLENLFDVVINKNKGEKQPKTPEYSFKEHSFFQLLEVSEQLKKVRTHYTSLPAAERRMAADYEYNASIADQIFYDSIGKPKDPVSIPGEVVALAIDPEYAPAILTIGTHEYIYGRIDEAMKLFLSLIELPKDTEDLFVIIDKAGAFLLQAKETALALTLYTAASEQFPGNDLFETAINNCHEEY